MLPLPLEILAADPPPPWNFQQPSVGGGGEYVYFLQLHIAKQLFFPWEVTNQYSEALGNQIFNKCTGMGKSAIRRRFSFWASCF